MRTATRTEPPCPSAPAETPRAPAARQLARLIERLEADDREHMKPAQSARKDHVA